MKTVDLKAIVDAVRACRLCRDAPRFGAPLPHEPRPVLRVSSTARILVASQAPGARVHASGMPFTDQSGVRLRSWMGVDEAIFYDVSRIAIAPMGFCFPGYDSKGADIPPRRECAATWHQALFAALPQIEFILAVGAPAQRYHLTRLGRPDLIGASLTETVSNWRAIRDGTRPRLYPLPHPSWRNNGWIRTHPWFESELLPAMRADLSRMLAASA
ncbi:MAG: uracil-DNA glycosylase [Rhizobiales bacterium 65-9]|nr:MAG: uracil-DNA glycosylase [Rhizobiales bacterium 65-9]